MKWSSAASLFRLSLRNRRAAASSKGDCHPKEVATRLWKSTGVRIGRSRPPLSTMRHVDAAKPSPAPQAQTKTEGSPPHPTHAPIAPRRRGSRSPMPAGRAASRRRPRSRPGRRSRRSSRCRGPAPRRRTSREDRWSPCRPLSSRLGFNGCKASTPATIRDGRSAHGGARARDSVPNLEGPRIRKRCLLVYKVLNPSCAAKLNG